MRLREIEARVVKLEKDARHNALARLSEEELNSEIIRLLNKLAADHPTYDALIEEVAATPEPGMQECARRMRWFLDDYVPRHPELTA